MLTRGDWRERRPVWRRTARNGLVLYLVVCLVALATVFAAPVPALAQDTVFRGRSFSDVPKGQAAYFDVVATAGIIRGDGGLGGLCRPSEPVTRAEFAVMAQRLLVLDPERPAPETTALPFSDASSIPAWAATAVASCHAQGLIGGEPDGAGGLAFSPWETVSGAEAIAILLRALGNDVAIAGGWPTGYIFRAYETGLLSSDVGAGDWRMLGPLTPMTRAQMAYLSHNALFSSRGYRAGAEGREGTFARASIGGSLGGSALVIDLDTAAHTLTVAEGGGRTLPLGETVVAAGVTGRGDLVGYRVYWLENGLGVIGYLQRFGREEPVTGNLTELRLSPDRKRVTAIVVGGSTEVPCAPGAILELNGRRWPFDPGTILPLAQVTAVTSQGQVVYASILQEDLPEAVIRSLSFDQPEPGQSGAGDAPTGRITARIGMGEGDIPLVVTRETVLFLDGKPADLADLRERDVLYVATEGSTPKRALRLYAYRNRVTGVVRNFVRQYDQTGVYSVLKVDDFSGTEVTLPVSPYCDDRVSPAIMGQRLTFCLNRLGQVTFFSAPPPPPQEPKVVKVLREVVAGGHHLLTVDWQGAELTYRLLPEFEPPPVGTLALFVVSADGLVVRATPPSSALFDAVVVYADPLTNRLTLTRDGRNWFLDVTSVPVYAATGVEAGDLVGSALPLAALTPGQRVWLDEPAAPGYILLVP